MFVCSGDPEKSTSLRDLLFVEWAEALKKTLNFGLDEMPWKIPWWGIKYELSSSSCKIDSSVPISVIWASSIYSVMNES